MKSTNQKTMLVFYLLLIQILVLQGICVLVRFTALYHAMHDFDNKSTTCCIDFYRQLAHSAPIRVEVVFSI